MQHRRASVSGRAHGDRPDRASSRPGDVRGSEDSAGQSLREPARGGDGAKRRELVKAARVWVEPFREAGRHLPLRLHRDRGQQAGAPGRRVPPRVAITGASVYIRASSNEAPNPCRGHSWRRTRKSPSSRRAQKGPQPGHHADREDLRKGRHHADGGRLAAVRVRSSRRARSTSTRPSGSAAFRGAGDGDLRPRVERQDHAGAALVANAQRLGGAAAYIDAEHGSTSNTPRSWAWTSTTCWFPSRTRGAGTRDHGDPGASGRWTSW